MLEAEARTYIVTADLQRQPWSEGLRPIPSFTEASELGAGEVGAVCATCSPFAGPGPASL